MANEDANVPGFTANPDLQAKLDSLDDNLVPLNEEKKDDKAELEAEEVTDEEDEAVEETEDTEEEAESADSETAESEESKTDTDDGENGYTIDEGDEEEEAPTTSTQESAAKGQYSAEEQYILENISAFKVQGYAPGSEKLETFDVLTIEQLPPGFKYASENELALAMKRDNFNEQKAIQLQNDFRLQQTQKAANEFKTREDNADRQDIGNLQRQGELPRFKKDPNAKDFDSDPGVALVNEILTFKEEQNKKYLDEYNAGRPYKHIGFEEAYRMFKYKNPNKVDTDLQAEDNARKNLAKRTTKAKGSPTQPANTRSRARGGMTSRDLDNLIESLDW